MYKKILLVAAAAAWLLPGTTGCGKDEEKAPSGYYTGPMKQKGATSTTSDSAPPNTAAPSAGGANPSGGR